MEIPRTSELSALAQRLSHFPIIAILGPRQCGKTTLVHQYAAHRRRDTTHFFDLENPDDLARLANPMSVLSPLEGTIVIDEIQLKPELFPILRVLADRKNKTQFIILGSASPDLVRGSSESLAGRVSHLQIGGLQSRHLPRGSERRLWLRGGFPRSFLAKSDELSHLWRMDFVATFLERDLPRLGLRIPAETLRRFWLMISHYHGQIFNASEIGRSLMVSEMTSKHYLDILTGTYMIRRLQPWHYNTKKRLVKRPKIYFRDSGLFHTLLSVKNWTELQHHPKLGASWEGFAMEETIGHLGLTPEEVFFWATHTGGELDLVFLKNGKLWGIEFKHGDAPRMTPSMTSAHAELKLAHLWVVYPGKENYPLSPKTTAVSIQRLESIQLS